MKALRNAVRRGSLARVIFGAPRDAAAPVAKASSVSDVDVSPSMVTALKVSVTPSRRRACSADAEIGASVKTKDSMVAISGAIMPAPLAIPLMTTLALPSFASAVATFGKVSVVMIALAASMKRPCSASSASVLSTPSNFVASSGSPMTPVEARKMSLTEQPTASAAILAVKAVDDRPDLPVNALALPELTTRARALPPFSLARHHSTGADGHFERVKTPATVVPLSNTANSTSVRFL